MNLLRHLLALSLLLGSVAGAVVVYKWTDQNGVVHYSDQPVPGAEKIQTGTPNVSHLGTSSSAGAAAPQKPPPKSQPKLGYTEMSIGSPTAEQTFFNTGVPVRLNLEPDLQSSHTLNWYLDGVALDSHQGAVQFQLDDVPRGTHTLTATIVDSETQDSTSSAPVTFYVHQASVLSPQHPKP